jgi:hypothetical protein
VQYFHDEHWYNSFPRLESKVKGAQKIFYLQIPLVNNGYCYRVIGTDEICRDEITLHQGKTHSQGIGGYVELKPEAASPLSRFATLLETGLAARISTAAFTTTATGTALIFPSLARSSC